MRIDRTVIACVTLAGMTTTGVSAQTILDLSNIKGASSIVEGYGAVTTGGSGGTIYRVTTLADSGPGSLRDAVSRTGRRTVVFDVAGTITLLSNIFIRQPYLTVDGSTAPSPGVTIQMTSETVGQFIVGGTHDIILRHLRFSGVYQGGSDPAEGDLLGIDGDEAPDHHAHRIVFDHLTCRGSTDGAPDLNGRISDVTISWCMIYNCWHPTLSAYDDDLAVLRSRISMHHNVYARNGERNPQLKSGTLQFDYVNNVVFAYGYYGASSAYGMRIRNTGFPQPSVNVINNYFAPTILPSIALIYGLDAGPDVEDGAPRGPFPQGTVVANTLLGPLYVAGNVLPPQNVDSYSTIAVPVPTPTAAQLTIYPANELKARVLPLAGVRYRWASEQAILDDAGQVMSGPSRILGDLDLDGSVDGTDIARLLACQGGSNITISPSCAAGDLDGDDDCDQDDFGALQRCFSGSNRSVSNPVCLK